MEHENALTSAELLLSEEEILQRADELLARGGVDSSVLQKEESVSRRYVKRASSVAERRSLVQRHLHLKWSVKSAEAAVIKINSRPIAVMRDLEDADLDGTSPHSETRPSRRRRYSSWCAVCHMKNEWCGFEHLDPGSRVLQPISSLSPSKMSQGEGLRSPQRNRNRGGRSDQLAPSRQKIMVRFRGNEGMAKFESRVKHKARLRRGKTKRNVAWLAGSKQRASLRHWNSKRIASIMRMTGEMDSTQDWLKLYYYSSEEDGGETDGEHVDEKQAKMEEEDKEPGEKLKEEVKEEGEKEGHKGE